MNNFEQTTTQQVVGPPRVTGLPATNAANDHDSLVARLADEMSQAWRRGERLGAETHLDRHPDLWNVPAAVLDLLYEEICLRQEHRELVKLDHIVCRFPAWQAQIEVLITCAQALETGVVGDFSRVGDVIGDFLLRAEIGRGAQGRVFAATESSLGDRPVVLKITARGSQEHLSLARLQHTHIVPLLSVLDEPERNLRVLCMPYFGGLTLAALLAKLQNRPLLERTGRHLLQVLDEARATAPVSSPPGRDPATPFLSRATYVQAMCWLGACLAEALKYAHERGLVHLDLKPSNVLLTADRQPMLLDFHLAQEPLEPGAAGARFGGTPAYMSPEQKSTIAAIRQGGLVAEAIDGRSDIFSLGLVMYEALGGPIEEDSRGQRRPLRHWNAQVSPGLSDVIAKCLSSDVGARYSSAGEFAADLWAHLNDVPLKGVANRSLTERWQKWRRRRPHLLSLYAMLAIIFVVAGTALAFAFLHVGHRVTEARQALDDGQTHMNAGQYVDAANTFQRGLTQVAGLPANQNLKAQLTKRLELATRAQVAGELHRITDRFRFLYGLDAYPSDKVKALEANTQAFWEKRHDILTILGKDLGPALEQSVPLDLLDLAILGSNLHVRLAPRDQLGAARRDALQMLDEAAKLFGPSKVLFHERRLLAEALGDVELVHEARQLEKQYQPRTAWEHYALGRSLLLAGEADAAASQFDEAVRQDPTGLWPNFYSGICNYRLGRFLEATEAFTVCVAQAPKSAGCFYNRGLAYIGLGRQDLAQRDLQRASELEPSLAEAARRLRATLAD